MQITDFMSRKGTDNVYIYIYIGLYTALIGVAYES